MPSRKSSANGASFFRPAEKAKIGVAKASATRRNCTRIGQ